MPFVEEQFHTARALMGADFWSYGLAPNRPGLDAFLRLRADEPFHASTHETVKV